MALINYLASQFIFCVCNYVRLSMPNSNLKLWIENGWVPGGGG